MMVGINWFLGYSHTSKAASNFITHHMTAERIADVLEVFFDAGVDSLYGVLHDRTKVLEAVKMAEDRTGRRCITLALPTLDVAGTPEAADENARLLDKVAATGATFCLPHQQTTDALLDRTTRTIRGLDRMLAMIRERGMIPGLSTHTPEAPVYADETGLDVATYIQIYNALGFLMQVEVDWVQRVIWNAAKPVIVIKPLAAGRIMPPLVGLAFVWATIRERDLVCVGTKTPDEAREVIEISRAVLERRVPDLELQTTRSKNSLKGN